MSHVTRHTSHVTRHKAPHHTTHTPHHTSPATHVRLARQLAALVRARVTSLQLLVAAQGGDAALQVR